MVALNSCSKSFAKSKNIGCNHHNMFQGSICINILIYFINEGIMII